MGRFSATEDVTISKLDLASAQLEDAIQLFLQARYWSAITLAGAADGIFSGLLKEDAPDGSTWREIEELRASTGLRIAGNRSEKEVFAEWNHSRNRLKHHGRDEDDSLRLNAFDEAYSALQRANLGGDRLNVRVNSRDDYENWLMINIYGVTPPAG